MINTFSPLAGTVPSPTFRAYPAVGDGTISPVFTRTDIVDLLAATMLFLNVTKGHRSAWQGQQDAPQRWATSTGLADLDIWCDEESYLVYEKMLTEEMKAVMIQHSTDPHRLQHTSFVVHTTTGPAIVDFTRHNLKVGPILLMPANSMTTVSTADGSWLTGAAAAVDLFIRPLLRGRIVEEDRLTEAREAWCTASQKEQQGTITLLSHELGKALTDDLVAVLNGATPASSLVKRAARRLTAKSLAVKNLPSTWHEHKEKLSFRKKKKPFGLSTQGALIVLVGTDGSGKSTVADKLATQLNEKGIDTSTAYMGMGRGNLPGVALARRLLNIPSTTETSPMEKKTSTSVDTPPNQHTMLRRVAAWYYAAEYLYRYGRDIRPQMKKGNVVICDRYVYDLRESPSPGSFASTVAEYFMPRPDVLILPDAPDEIIHARKPERTAEEQAEQQGRFRQLIIENPARIASLTVDTSGRTAAYVDTLAPAVSATFTALHASHITTEQ